MICNSCTYLNKYLFLNSINRIHSLCLKLDVKFYTLCALKIKVNCLLYYCLAIIVSVRNNFVQNYCELLRSSYSTLKTS